MRQIVIFADCYFPTIKSVSFLIRDLANEFQNLGVEVVLIVADKTVSDSYSVERTSLITIIRVRAFDTKNSSPLRRGLSELLLPFLMHSVVKKIKSEVTPDLILVYSPSIFLSIAAKRLKSLTDAPVYLILRDIFPDWAIDAKVIKSKPVQSILRFFARYQFKVSDRIGLQSKRDLRRFQHGHYAGDSHKSELLPNWRASWVPPPVDNSLRERLRLKNKIVFLIGGSVGPAQDPELIFRIAQSIEPHHHAHFLFIGNGPYFSKFEERIKAQAITNITMIPEMAFNEYAMYLMMADVGTLLLNSQITSDNIPGRFLDYLQASLPVLALINQGNELVSYIESEGIGATATSSDFDAALKAVVKLASTLDVRTKLGKKGPQLLARDFSPESAAAKITSFFSKVHQKK